MALQALQRTASRYPHVGSAEIYALRTACKNNRL